MPQLTIGLTGGIASGKSFVATEFENLGITVVDTDIVAREVVEPGTPGLAAVEQAFGAEIIGPDGSLDRRHLRTLVFASPERKRTLEALLHPLIRVETLKQLESATGPYAMVVVPLLVETGFGAIVDRVLVVDCPVETQLSRLMERDAHTRDEAQRIINQQAGRDDRLRAADDVIDNDGSLDATRAQVKKLHEQYLTLATKSCT